MRAMTKSPNPVSLRPDYAGARARLANAIFKAAAVAVRQVGSGIYEAEAVRQLGAGEDAQMVLKGTTVPTSLANSGLSAMGVAEFAVLAPASAAVQLMASGLSVSLTGVGMVQLPTYLTTAADAGGWVAEGAPIRVRGLSLAPGLKLEPRKLGVISTFTRELSEHSSIEAVVRAVLSRAVGLALDAAVFSSTADDGTAPGGILNGVADEGASGGTGQAALIADVSKLAGALSAKGGGTSVVFVTDPASAMRMRLWAPARFDAPILASSAITVDTLIAVEAGAFVAAFNPTPEITASTEGLINEEDTNPAQIVAANGTAAGPTRSLWQTDCVALKTILRGNFGMRGALVARVASVNW
jgi:hypothetical protein